MQAYVAVIRKDNDTDYGVDSPDFPACISAGTTIDEAVALGREALAGHVAVMTEYGEEIPNPTDTETILSGLRNRDDFVALFLASIPPSAVKSVRVNITVPKPWLRQIDNYARRHGISRSALLVESSMKVMKT